MAEHTPSLLLSSRHRRKIIVSIMSAAALYLAVVLYTGHEQALMAFKKIGLWGWLLLIASSFTSYCVRYIRWQYYLKLNGHYLPLHVNFLYYLSALALTTTPGKAGETIRSVLLRPHGVPYHTSLACFVVERFLDLMVVTLLSFLILSVYQGYAYFALVVLAVLVAVLPFIRSEILHTFLWTWHHKHKASRLGHVVGHIHHLLQYARKLLLAKNLYIGLSLGLLAWGIQGLAFYYLLGMLDFNAGLAMAMGIYALSLLAGAASFVPGGIGSTELVMGLLLSAMGADSTVVITAPLINRLSTLWFAVSLGLIASGSINFLRRQVA